MEQLGWIQPIQSQSPTGKIPLQFNFPPVQIITKQLTKLNSTHPYRISYLGPRWQNSVIFHKKYSKNSLYPFKQSKLSRGSNFIHQSMSHNQFYKNQFYYRAFEGMNPTLNLQQQMLFESRFQCGNLDCAIKISNNEYDLFLRIDSNTRGNIFWFYFTLTNPHHHKTVRLNICNLTKNGTHYTKGLNPFMFSSHAKVWTQQGIHNTSFEQKRLRYHFLYDKVKVDKFYQLSFEVNIDHQEEIQFAYCVPYPYSQLLNDLQLIKDKAEVGILGQTLTGINIPVVMIGSYDPHVKKQITVITGRIHPGQTNSSLIISNLMKTLCLDQQMQSLRQTYNLLYLRAIFIIVPMVNPDGVILGNSRTGAAGLDLNRQFKSKNKSLFPQTTLIKRLVSKIMEKDEVQLYLDFHGHSRKKNMFIFGPPYNVTQPQYYRCRVFPKILSNLTTLFRYYSCQFDIPSDKKSTARAVMLNQLLIPFVFTIETSLGFYYDYNNHKTEVFTKQKWEQLGMIIANALKEYYEGISQYQQFLESKRKSKKNLCEDLKLTKQKSKDKEFGTKQIRLLKWYEQIKQCQQRKSKEQKKDEDNLSSDSHDEHQNLQKEKIYQFGRMVTQFLEEEQNKLRTQSQKPRAISRKDQIQHSPDSKKKNLQVLRRRQKKWREDQQLLNQQLLASENKKKVIAANKKNRKLNKQQNFIVAVRNQLSSQQIQRGLSLNNQKQQLLQRTKIIPKQQSIQDNYGFSGDKKFTSKMNIRMFNFQKTISNQKSIRYSQGKDIAKAKELNIHKNKNLSELKKRFDEKKNIEDQLKKESLPNKSNCINLDYIQDDDSQQKQQQLQLSNGKAHKSKYLFPSSFYRIKYQHHKKKMQTKKRNEEIEQKGELRIKEERSLVTIGLLETNNFCIDSRDKKQGLFVKIKRFPLL